MKFLYICNTSMYRISNRCRPYNVPPRPMFDPSRPPMPGSMPNYGNYRGPRGREFAPRPMRGRTPPGYIYIFLNT